MQIFRKVQTIFLPVGNLFQDGAEGLCSKFLNRRRRCNIDYHQLYAICIHFLALAKQSTMLYLLTIAIVAATLTHGVAVASLRARAEITPQAAANYLVQTTYTDAACLHLSTGSTTQADLCLRTNAGKFQKITSFANNATTTSYAESTCMTVTSIVTESLLVSCTLRQSGYYGMSSFSTAPTFPSQEQGITIR